MFNGQIFPRDLWGWHKCVIACVKWHIGKETNGAERARIDSTELVRCSNRELHLMRTSTGIHSLRPASKRMGTERF